MANPAPLTPPSRKVRLAADQRVYRAFDGDRWSGIMPAGREGWLTAEHPRLEVRLRVGPYDDTGEWVWVYPREADLEEVE